MLEIVRGQDNKPAISGVLEEFIKEIDIDGVLYIGYPIIPTNTASIFIDASIVSPTHGLVLFDLVDTKDIGDRADIQDEIYNCVEGKLKLNKKLLNRRNLIPKINVLTFAPNSESETTQEEYYIAKDKNDIKTYLSEIYDENNKKIYKELLSDIQAVTTIKTYSDRGKVLKENSRGAKMKRIEASIATLDRFQNQAVIETVEGPQRIRGLAGSGKTIVLALKAAYLHSMNKDWDIAVTFNTRSLKGQIIELIERFTFQFIKQKPNWNKIKVIHAWGSTNFDGIYYQVCKTHNIEYLDFGKATSTPHSKYSSEFDYVCSLALDNIGTFNQMFDAILIDEAQDFSDAFLKLCYNILKQPKRIIWAYDELQTLNKTSMKSPEEIFGYDADGEPLVKLVNNPAMPKQDIILKKCYRNSRPILTTAHALGFGVYRNEGLVQMFDDTNLWEQIGYSILNGVVGEGENIQLQRTTESSPIFLENHSELSDLLVHKVFKNNTEQSDWIVEQIEKNLEEDELEYKDILIIHTNPQTTRQATGYIRSKLFEKGIASHLAGVTSSPDEFFIDDSIAVSGIYRAKGNEAAMVYIMNCEECYNGFELIKKRNILFTAMTRSKGWVRLCGIGKDMEELIKEIDTTIKSEFVLRFKYPTLREREELNIIHRDRTESEKREIEKKNNVLKDIAKALENGDISKFDLDKDTVKNIIDKLKGISDEE